MVEGMVKYNSYAAQANCDDCDFLVFSKNAHGIAAQHAYRYKHTVHIQVEKGYTITPEGSDWVMGWKEMHKEKP